MMRTVDNSFTNDDLGRLLQHSDYMKYQVQPTAYDELSRVYEEFLGADIKNGSSDSYSTFLSEHLQGGRRASGYLQLNLQDLDREACLSPDIVVPLMRMGQYDASRPFIVNHLRTQHREEFEALAITSPEFLSNLAQYNPELITVDLAKKILTFNGSQYSILPDRLKARYDLALMAVKRSGWVLGDVPLSLWNDDLIESAIRQNPDAVQFVTKENVSDAARYYELACGIYGGTIRLIPASERSVALWKIALEDSPWAIEWLYHNESEDIFPDLATAREVTLIALKENANIYAALFDYASFQPLKYDPEIIDIALSSRMNVDAIIRPLSDIRRDIIFDALSSFYPFYPSYPAYFYLAWMLEDLYYGIPREMIVKIIKKYPDYYKDLPIYSPYSVDEEILDYARDGDLYNLPAIVSNPNVSYDYLAAMFAEHPEYYRFCAADLRHEKFIREAAKDPENLQLVLANENTPDDMIIDSLKRDWKNILYLPVRRTCEPYVYDTLKDNPQTRAMANLPHCNETLSRFRVESYPEAGDLHYENALRTRLLLETLIAGKNDDPEHPHSPVALLIFGKDDWNGAFGPTTTFDWWTAPVDAAYYEITDDAQFLSIVNYYLPLLQAGDVVYLAGHGTQTSLLLKKSEDPAANFDMDHLDTGDKAEFMESIPANNIHDGVILFLQSCSNAAGGPGAVNMMTTMDGVFRDRWHVIAISVDSGNNFLMKPGRVVVTGKYEGPIYHLIPGGDSYEVLDEASELANGFQIDSLNKWYDNLTWMRNFESSVLPSQFSNLL